MEFIQGPISSDGMDQWPRPSLEIACTDYNTWQGVTPTMEVGDGRNNNDIDRAMLIRFSIQLDNSTYSSSEHFDLSHVAALTRIPT